MLLVKTMNSAEELFLSQVEKSVIRAGIFCCLSRLCIVLPVAVIIYFLIVVFPPNAFASSCSPSSPKICQHAQKDFYEFKKVQKKHNASRPSPYDHLAVEAYNREATFWNNRYNTVIKPEIKRCQKTIQQIKYIVNKALTRPFPPIGRKDNYGLLGSTATTQEIADIAGAIFVGQGCRIASDGRTLISGDGLRQYRPASYKARTGYIQANFEKAVSPNGKNKWISDGHVNIIN